MDGSKNSINLHLRSKSIAIAITNVCNLTCGGCCQLIGHFPKEKLFFTPIEEIHENILTAIRVANQDWHKDWFPLDRRRIDIYGGEPTIHPQWDEIVEMLYEFEDYPFVICTNGVKQREVRKDGFSRFDYLKSKHLNSSHHRNVFYRVDTKEPGRMFVPTLISPSDIESGKTPVDYAEQARRICVHWVEKYCQTLIYRNRGYFCVNAGPMDWLWHGGKNGWRLDVEHPFDRTLDEINQQMRLFCHRCYHCVGNNPPIHQSIQEKSLATASNLVQLKSGTFQEYGG